MKEDVGIIIGFIIFVYVLINGTTLVAGIIDINGWRFQREDCQKIARIDYIFPGHQLGCYLGKPLENN